MKKRVLVTYNMLRPGYSELEEKYDVTFPPEGRESFTYGEVLSMIGEYDALQSMFNFKVDAPLMEAGRKLKIISNYAVGFDNIDVEAATRLKIQVTNTPHQVTEPTRPLYISYAVFCLKKKKTTNPHTMRLTSTYAHCLHLYFNQIVTSNPS